MLSNTSRYALRAVIYLAANSNDETRIGIKKIAEELDIPSPFLGKILQILAKKRILISIKGPNGGFAYPTNGNNVTLYDIVTVIDGDELFTKCLLSDKNCAEEKKVCPIHKDYAKIRQNIVKLFKEHTIKDVALSTEKKKNLVF